MPYKRINNLLGWLCFLIAAVTYILTLEPSVSFWDCGEFISCAYRLQVSHQPGYPMFAMICKAFSLLAMGNNARIPYFTNMGCGLASAATVMFLFWTITALTKKAIAGRDKAPESYQQIIIMGSGLVGALTFAFSDTFWFSAVETIVFAQSALCIAIVFWAALKWDASADQPGADKWIVFIAYVMGLSIGIHLLNLLTIPAIVLVYYFRHGKNITFWRALGVFSIGVALLIFVQYGIIQYTVKLAGYADLLFVNKFGLGFGSGAVTFLVLLIALLIAGIVISLKYNKRALNLALICVAFIYFGYSAFAYIPIRAHAGTNLNNSNPDNAFTLTSYLNREQYTPSPLVYGPYFDGKYVRSKQGAAIYRKDEKRYAVAGHKYSYVYDHNTVFPRIFSTDPSDAEFYRGWLQLGDKDRPNFIDNLKFFFSWQVYQMYIRYFFWNFVGRYNQSDGQSSTSGIDGNWTGGVTDLGAHLPASVVKANTYTPLFALPLIIGLMGMIYHFSYRRRDGLVVALLWFFMGLGIVIYVNQPDVQPRERDYSYVGSFYAFAIWVGMGVAALAELLSNVLKKKRGAIAASAVCLLLAPALMARQEWGAHDRSTKLTPHDMAYNYLVSCPPNAVLFTYGDNDTYSLWYDQEVEGIRPDVRIINLSLFSGDWYIRQMQGWMNKSAPLPITMPFDKYKDGIRDVLYYNDDSLKESVELGQVVDFMLSDDPKAKVEYTSGEKDNFLPTRNLKLRVNAASLLANGQIGQSEKALIDTSISFKYTSNYVTKDKLAMMDLLAHNNWQRPICFAVTVGQDVMMGLQPYLYKEGFTYRLLPFKRDKSVHDELSKVHTLTMYDNVVNKFRYGNFKSARYLDPESKEMFYPVMVSTFADLVHNLLKEDRPDMALKALRKYDQELPDLYPYPQMVFRKLSLAGAAYHLKDDELGNKMMDGMLAYIKDQLDFQYYSLKHDNGQLSPSTIQNDVLALSKMATLAKAYNQPEMGAKLIAQLQKYVKQFEPVLGKNGGFSAE